MSATMPAARTCRRSSERLKRDSGSPSVEGSSQARAFTSATTRGGKSRRPTSPRPVLESLEAFSVEAFSPLAHHRARHIETLGDLLVLDTLRGQQDDLGAHHVPIR